MKLVRLPRWIYNKKLNVSEYKILDALHSILGKDKMMGINELSRTADISKRTAWLHLPRLTKQGFVKRVLVGKYPKYCITPKGISRKHALVHQWRTIDFASSSDAEFLRIEPGDITRDSSATVTWQGSLSEQERSAIKLEYANFVRKVKKITADKDISLRVIGTLKQKS